MDEIIKSVNEAEAQAAKIKSDAVVRAGKIIEQARAQASEIERAAAAERTAYRENAIKVAEEQAEKDYNAAIKKSGADAEQYAENVLRYVEVTVGKIVGRVSGGNC